MMVTIGWRTRVGTFFSEWTVPLALVTILGVPPVTFYLAPLSAVITFAGLLLDCLGAITLAGGVWASSAARLRAHQPLLAEGISHMTCWQRWVGKLPLAVGRRYGSSDSTNVSPTAVEELVDVSWGLAMLCVGFLGQSVGTFLQMKGLK
jgi:hypothetical protein